MKLVLAILPPGAAGGPVKVAAMLLDISSDNAIDLWLKEQRGNGLTCACGCGRRMEVQRHHHCRGLPKCHSACRAKGMQGNGRRW